jgi:tRNA(Leu) C34 or U34 (ribose-2'-O)-methylase TrmL
MRGYSAIGLAHPKTPANVGSALRAAGVFGAAFVAYTGSRYSKAPTDPQKAYRHLPLLRAGDSPEDLRGVIPFDCVPVAVDLLDGARPLPSYEHPERAFYVFGPEDGTLGKQVLSWCRDVVVIPARDCLNLAAAVNVVLYDRASKRGAE